jgi:hypothetical protein
MLLLVWQRQPPTVSAAGVHGSELGAALVSLPLPSGLIGANRRTDRRPAR